MSESPIPSVYQSDHLLLLVGTNPLPNYVAAQLLLKEGGRVYLVHSKGPRGTGQVAQRLATQLPQYQPQLIAVDPLDTAAIRRCIHDVLGKMPPAGVVGLNYTGGTKTMAVHGYQAADEFCRRHDREVVFSYLDAETLAMCVEPAPRQPGFKRNVVEAVDISIKDLMKLHDIKLQGQLRVEPLLPDLACSLAHLHATPTEIETWQKGRTVLAGCQGHLWQDVRSELLQVGIPSNVTCQIEQALGLVGTSQVDLGQAARRVGLKSQKELLLWLQGTWLEDWVLTCVRNLEYPHRARGLKGFAPQEFEIDVAVMRGYQLFALSCSVTDDRGRAKGKLLEIYTRAQQVGGDEARIAAVCPVADPRGLQQEITHDWDTGNRVRVFGSQHLPDLQIHLKNWFETA